MTTVLVATTGVVGTITDDAIATTAIAAADGATGVDDGDIDVASVGVGAVCGGGGGGDDAAATTTATNGDVCGVACVCVWYYC